MKYRFVFILITVAANDFSIDERFHRVPRTSALEPQHSIFTDMRRFRLLPNTYREKQTIYLPSRYVNALKIDSKRQVYVKRYPDFNEAVYNFTKMAIEKLMFGNDYRTIDYRTTEKTVWLRKNDVQTDVNGKNEITRENLTATQMNPIKYSNIQPRTEAVVPKKQMKQKNLLASNSDFVKSWKQIKKILISGIDFNNGRREVMPTKSNEMHNNVKSVTVGNEHMTERDEKTGSFVDVSNNNDVINNNSTYEMESLPSNSSKRVKRSSNDTFEIDPTIVAAYDGFVEKCTKIFSELKNFTSDLLG